MLDVLFYSCCDAYSFLNYILALALPIGLASSNFLFIIFIGEILSPVSIKHKLNKRNHGL